MRVEDESLLAQDAVNNYNIMDNIFPQPINTPWFTFIEHSRSGRSPRVCSAIVTDVYILRYKLTGRAAVPRRPRA